MLRTCPNQLHRLSRAFNATLIVGFLASSAIVLPVILASILDPAPFSVPLPGYHENYYTIAVSVPGTTSFAALGFLLMPAPLAALLMLLGHLQLATVDLLCEGKCTEKMVEHMESGSDLVSFVWGLVNLGGYLQGPLRVFTTNYCPLKAVECGSTKSRSICSSSSFAGLGGWREFSKKNSSSDTIIPEFMLQGTHKSVVSC